MNTKSTENTNGFTDEAYSRWRAAWLGDPHDDKYKGKPRPQSARVASEVISLMGQAVRLSVLMTHPKAIPDPADEKKTEREIRVLGEQEDFGRAYFSLQFTPGFEWPDDPREVNVAILDEYRRMQAKAEGRSVTDGINASVRKRVWHYRQKEGQRRRYDDQLNSGMRVWLMERIAASQGPPAVPTPDEEFESRQRVAYWLEEFPPAERRALERLLSGEPPTGGSGRQALSRATRRLRRMIEAEQNAD